MNKSDWLLARKKGLGSTDAAPVLGMSRWGNPLTVYLDKIGESPEREDNETMEWGRRLESVVADAFAEKNNCKLYHPGEIFYHKDYHFLLANVDRVIDDGKSLLECKTANQYKTDEWEDGKIPIEYQLQVMHQLAVTGLQTGHIACLIGGQKYVQAKIERDEAMIDMIVKREVEFWNEFVVKRQPPFIDGSKASTEILKLLYPTVENFEQIQIPDSFNDLIEKRKELQFKVDTLDFEIDQIENQLKHALKSNESGLTNKYIVSWKECKMNRLNTELLKREQKAMFDAYIQSSSYRRFNIKELKS